MKKVLIDCSNLSCHPTREIRTGIQEVQYRVLLSLVRRGDELASKFPGVVFRPLLSLPPDATITDATPPFVLERIHSETGAEWMKDFIGTENSKKELARTDLVHFQGLVPLQKIDRYLGDQTKLGLTLHDISPVIYPDYAGPGMSQWFREEFLPALSELADFVVGDSLHTAKDLIDSPWGSKIPRIGYLPLASRLEPNSSPNLALLEKFGLKEKNYFVFLGSWEPRKNYVGALRGFVEFSNRFPETDVNFLWIGGTGWKNEGTDFSRVKKAGYMSDEEMRDLIQLSAGLVMISVYEGFGIPLAQARSLGIPVITHFGSSLPEACGGVGIFVDPGNPASIAEGFRRSWSVVRGEFKSSEDREITTPSDPSWTWDRYTDSLCAALVETLK